MVMRIAIIVAILLHSWSALAQESRNTAPVAPSNDVRSADPDYKWKHFFFEEINARAKVAGLPALREAVVPQGDLEVRVWHGFGLFLLKGFVLKRSAGQWSAMYLEGYDERGPRNEYQINLPTPKTGWEECWKKLEGAGLLTLPDASQLGAEPIDPDVLSYVVEYNVGGDYRTYHYTNPEGSDRREAKQMVEIGGIISEEFELPTLKPK
jgi:hypothetical protein